MWWRRKSHRINPISKEQCAVRLWTTGELSLKHRSLNDVVSIRWVRTVKVHLQYPWFQAANFVGSFLWFWKFVGVQSIRRMSTSKRMSCSDYDFCFSTHSDKDQLTMKKEVKVTYLPHIAVLKYGYSQIKGSYTGICICTSARSARSFWKCPYEKMLYK